MPTQLSFSDIALFGALVTVAIILLFGLLIALWAARSGSYLARLRRLEMEREESTGKMVLQVHIGPRRPSFVGRFFGWFGAIITVFTNTVFNRVNKAADWASGKKP